MGLFILANISTDINNVCIICPQAETTIFSDDLKTSDINSLNYGTRYGPDSIDPHCAVDPWSFNVIEQVVETLFSYDFSDPELSIIPRLASDYGVWSPDGLNYTIPLKTGVIFHDGTSFNATAVKWSFDRLAYFMNISGTLPSSTSRYINSYLYQWHDGTPIIKRTEVINLYTVRFILNRPFGALEALLCYTGSGILAPSSTSFTDYISLSTGDLIGTGPFEYDQYINGIGVEFHAFENYWAGMANIINLNFTIINDEEI